MQANSSVIATNPQWLIASDQPQAICGLRLSGRLDRVFALAFVLALPTTPVWGDNFPAGEDSFNGMSISYSVSGVSLKAPKDVYAFTTSRSLEGTVSGNLVSFTATLNSKNAGHHATFTVVCGTNSAEETFVLCPATRSYSLTMPAPNSGGVAFGATVRLHATGNGGFVEDRVLMVGGYASKRGASQFMQLVTPKPGRGVLNVPWNKPEIGAIFSEDIEPWSVNSATVLLSYDTSPGTQVSCPAFKVSGSTAVGRPVFSKIGKRVTVTVRGGDGGIRSKKGAKLAKDETWTFTTMPELEVQVIPVQVVDGVPLVKDKPGVVRVKAKWPENDQFGNSTDVYKLSADVTLTYDGGSTFTRSGHMFYLRDFSQFARMTPKNVMLKGNSANFFSGTGEMPIITTAGEHTLSATVKPVGPASQTNEFKGAAAVSVRRYASGLFSVFDGYRVLYVPVNVGGWVAGTTHDTASLASRSDPVQLSLFPTARTQYDAHSEVLGIDPGPMPPAGRAFYANNLLRNLARYSRFNHDAVIGVAPAKWMSDVLGAKGLNGDILWVFSHRSCFVADDSKASIAPHELGHVLGLWHTDSYELRGYDVERDLLVDSAIRISPYGNELMESGINGVSDMKTLWISTPNYTHMLNKLTRTGLLRSPGSRQAMAESASEPADGPPTGRVVYVDGSILISNAVERASLDAVYAMPQGWVSDSAATGSHTIVVLNAVGDTLSQYRFDPDLRTNDDGSLYTFVLAGLPFDAAATRVVLRHGATNLAERAVSSHAPTVSVSSPVGGQVVSNALTIAWSAADGDSDPLRFAVLYSADAGRSWTPLADEITNLTYTFNTSHVPGGTQSLVKVSAHDGFLTGEGTSAVFTICNPPSVTSTAPNNGDTNVPPNTAIRFFFRDPIDPATLGAGTVSMVWADSNAVSGTVAYDAAAKAVVFTPSNALPWAVVVQAQLDSANLRDPWGSALATNATISFMTTADTQPPAWTERLPDEGDYDAPLNPRAFIVFDEPMDPATITNGGFCIATTNGMPVPGVSGYQPADRSAWFQPSNPLAARTTYVAVLGASAADLAGNLLSTNALTWTFQTGDAPSSGLRLRGCEGHSFMDTNSDGLWDLLAVRFGVEVSTNGTYGMNATLVTTNGNANLANALPISSNLVAGVRSLSVFFDAATLRAIQPFNPVVNVAAVTLYDAANLGRNDFVPDPGVSFMIPTDMDEDQIEDSWEQQHGLSFLDPTDAAADWDHDFLTNLQEYRLGTDLANADCDNDTLPDGWETAFGLSPTNAAPSPIGTVNMELLGGLALPGYSTDIAVQSNLAFVASSGNLQIVDVQMPASPVLVGSVAAGISTLKVAGRYVYGAALDDQGVVVVDVSVPAHPVVVGRTLAGSAQSLAVISNLVYVADMNSGLKIVDVSDPTNPVVVGACVLGNSWNYFGSVAVESNRAYVHDLMGALHVVDVSIPANPVALARLTHNARGAYHGVLFSNYLVSAYGNSGVGIVDVSKSTEPVWTALCATAGQATRVAVLSNLVFVVENGKVDVVDLAGITNAYMRDSTIFLLPTI